MQTLKESGSLTHSAVPERKGISASLVHLKTIPNQLSLVRLLLVPLLWIAAYKELPFYVGTGIILAGVTDYLDGLLARKFNQVTDFGKKLDTIVDYLLYSSITVWIWLLRPEVFTAHPALVFTWLFINTVSLAVGWIKFNKMSNRRFYSVRLAGIIGYAFICYSFMFGYNEDLFYSVIGFLLFSSVESLLLQLAIPNGWYDSRSIISGVLRLKS